jgi:hypothetical protein
MNFSLKPRQLLFAFIPGFFLILVIFILHLKFEFTKESIDIEKFNLGLIFLIIVISYLVGIIIDSIRDGAVENFFDFLFAQFTKNNKLTWKAKPINWNFFFHASEKEIEKLDDNFYIWYVVNLNITISILLAFIFLGSEILWDNYFTTLKHPHILFLTIFFLFLSGVILLINAWGLRKEISEITNGCNNNNKDEFYPHTNVYTRLYLTEHEIGVRSIKFIPKGTYVFKGDRSEMIWIQTKIIKSLNLSNDFQNLYDDFCVKKTINNVQMFGCPDNFNNMTISWYLNSSKKPNMACDENYDFYSISDIQPGEELTADYESYSE